MTGPDAEVEPDPQHPPSPQPQPSLSAPEVTLSAASAYVSRTCSRSSLIVHILSMHRHLSMDDAASPIDACQYVCDSGTHGPHAAAAARGLLLPGRGAGHQPRR